MKLLDFPGAPNPRKVRIFVAEKGIDLRVEAVDVRGGANRTPDFLAQKNPFGGLPVLELDDGTAISESVAICRYLEGRYPDPPLMGVDARDIAEVEMWTRRVEFELFQHVGGYFRNHSPFFADKYAQSAEVAEDCRGKARATLQWLDTVLADRPFVAGARYSLADITALVAVDLGSPSVFEIAPEQKNLSRWHAFVSQRPSASA